jgi:hypothetical protein
MSREQRDRRTKAIREMQQRDAKLRSGGGKSRLTSELRGKRWVGGR